MLPPSDEALSEPLVPGHRRRRARRRIIVACAACGAALGLLLPVAVLVPAALAWLGQPLTPVVMLGEGGQMDVPQHAR